MFVKLSSLHASQLSLWTFNGGSKLGITFGGVPIVRTIACARFSAVALFMKTPQWLWIKAPCSCARPLTALVHTPVWRPIAADLRCECLVHVGTALFASRAVEFQAYVAEWPPEHIYKPCDFYSHVGVIWRLYWDNGKENGNYDILFRV